MACPYLVIEDSFNEKYYCHIKEDYVKYDRYSEFCARSYSCVSKDYTDCPAFKHEDERRRRNGEPELKRR